MTDSSPVTLADLLHAINNLGKELHAFRLAQADFHHQLEEFAADVRLPPPRDAFPSSIQNENLIIGTDRVRSDYSTAEEFVALLFRSHPYRDVNATLDLTIADVNEANEESPQVLVQAITENKAVETNFPPKLHPPKLSFDASVEALQEPLFDAVSPGFDIPLQKAISPPKSFVNVKPKKCIGRLFADFHLEDKVYFNRGGDDTDIYYTSSNFIHK